MPTLAGDAKLQGNADFGDFQLLSQYFGQSGSWDEGNFTYGSTINFGDFQLLSQNFGQTASLSAGERNSETQPTQFVPDDAKSAASVSPLTSLAADTVFPTIGDFDLSVLGPQSSSLLSA
jgi:hypothetical protein